MFKGKPTKVIITGKAKEEFDELNSLYGNGRVGGTTKRKGARKIL